MSDGAPAGWAADVARLIRRRAGTIAILWLLVTAATASLAAGLRLDMDLRGLLPPHFPSASRLDRLSASIGQSSDLYVTIRSPSRDANVAFGQVVADRLAERSDLRYVVFRRDLAYFEARALLFAELGDLVSLRRRVIARIREEVAREAYGSLDSEAEPANARPAAPRTDVDFDADAMREKYGVDEAFDEYMEADEGRVMVVMMRPERPATDLAYARRLSDEVLALVEQLRPTDFHPEMTVDLDGSYVQHKARIEQAQNEVWAGSAAVFASMLLSLGLYFRSARSIVFAVTPLVSSIVAALAFAHIAFGALNLVSAFIFAVLLGLGIDFGIHVLARYRSERAGGLGFEAALAQTLATSGRATAAGAASTALAFAALAIADFRGFSQFGIIAAIGVTFALLSAVLVLPALIALFDRWRPWNPTSVEWTSTRRSPRMRRVLATIAVLLSVVGVWIAVWSVRVVDRIQFEHDLSALGPRPKASTGPRRASYRDAVGTFQTVDPAVAVADSPAQAELLQRQLQALLAMTKDEVAAFDPAHPPTRALPEMPEAFADPDEGDDDDEEDDENWTDRDLDDPVFVELERRALVDSVMNPDVAEMLGVYGRERLIEMREHLARVWSIYAFIPRQQQEKLAVIRDLRRRIDAKRDLMAPDSRREIDKWRHYLDVDAPMVIDELPEWIRAQFKDAEGTVGRIVVVSTGGSKAEIWRSRAIYAAYADLATPLGPVEFAADFFVIPEIFGAIAHDGPIVLALATAIMFVTAAVLLRRVIAVVAVSATVLLAFGWLIATMVALGLKLNFFNIIVLPLLLAMGQDDALHVSERAHEVGGDMFAAVRGTFGAVFMTTLTTVLGFGGIFFADHRGLNSIALLAVVGLTFTTVAAVIVLPVLLAALGRAQRWTRRAR